MIRRKNVRAFVDWNSQIGNAGQLGEARPPRQVENTANYVARTIACTLNRLNIADLYSVTMRLYYGWHSGLTPTPHRTALSSMLRDNLLPNARLNSTFDWSEMFGDVSSDAYDFRLQRRVGVHFPDTVRLQFGKRREKMTDTALSCDILFSCRSEPESYRIVMAEDDDVVPSVFMAEKWTKEKGGRTVILRSRENAGHLMMSGLLVGI